MKFNLWAVHSHRTVSATSTAITASARKHWELEKFARVLRYLVREGLEGAQWNGIFDGIRGAAIRLSQVWNDYLRNMGMIWVLLR